jgi:hypothetical protein
VVYTGVYKTVHYLVALVARTGEEPLLAVITWLRRLSDGAAGAPGEHG